MIMSHPKSLGRKWPPIFQFLTIWQKKKKKKKIKKKKKTYKKKGSEKKEKWE